ncbi:MAG: NADH-quinone oxidoreductase subunit NuoH [Anaerolineae bacterium]|nr:NADH-quinone oxidoreductase subunit NuoH [Thermoflexales bacterium]MDW8407085.1 NADH-quinone oxidoreductase subunit NuoH [Anaerolineae bacterium]
MSVIDTINNLIKIVGDAVADLVVGILGAGQIADLVIMGLGALVLCTAVALTFMGMTWAERKVVARIQNRVGPNQAGPFGLLQPIADGIKMFTKEDTTPASADRWVYNAAPLIIATFALLTFSVLPFAPGVVGANINIGVFFVIAVGSASTVAILMAGWGSNNKYSLLGAFRTVAQLVGYEVPMLLNVIPVIVLSGSMSLVDIVQRQTLADGNPGIPFIVYLPLSALAFFIAGVAETGRSPFDLLEAESEIVAGFHVEYSGMKFALFMLGEYVNTLAVSIVFVILFLGGYAGPILPSYIWLLIKTALVFFVFMWLRGTLPRVRVDQLMALNWKVMVPLSVVNIIAVLILAKVFVTSPGLQSANGGILVAPEAQALILFVANIVILLSGLSIMARRARVLRLAEEAQIESRRAANRATASNFIGGAPAK